MLASIVSNIPELSVFDQNELDMNPALNADPPPSLVATAATPEAIPLLGALLVADGLITPEQLQACLQLQSESSPKLPIGQILLRCGYITEQALAHSLELQRDLKLGLLRSIETRAWPLSY